jgi:Sua5/YciO/YrdC/YwlC family protein
MFVDIDVAKQILNEGGNVIIPTETVYGLAGSIKHSKAIESIYELKKRPKENPLIVHVSNMNQVLELVEELPQSFFDLVDSFWPGPLTLIVSGKESLNKLITGGLSTVAIRMPNHNQSLALIEKTGPLVAPSANLSGKPSGTRYTHLENDFGENIPILIGDHPIVG